MTAILVPRLNAQAVDACISVSVGRSDVDDVDRSRHGLFSLMARRRPGAFRVQLRHLRSRSRAVCHRGPSPGERF